MPAWIHDRANHIRAKNPGMPEGMAFAIATQQAHKLGKTPKGYGTAEGKRTAKAKYDKPKAEYTQTANPSSKSKTSSVDLALLKGFSDEMQKIAGVPYGLADVNKTVKPNLKMPSYSQPQPASPPTTSAAAAARTT